MAQATNFFLRDYDEAVAEGFEFGVDSPMLEIEIEGGDTLISCWENGETGKWCYVEHDDSGDWHNPVRWYEAKSMGLPINGGPDTAAYLEFKRLLKAAKKDVKGKRVAKSTMQDVMEAFREADDRAHTTVYALKEEDYQDYGLVALRNLAYSYSYKRNPNARKWFKRLGLDKALETMCSEAESLGHGSAMQAIDQAADYDSLEEAIDSLFNNLGDTLNENGLMHKAKDAVRAFNEVLAKHGIEYLPG